MFGSQAFTRLRRASHRPVRRVRPFPMFGSQAFTRLRRASRLPFRWLRFAVPCRSSAFTRLRRASHFLLRGQEKVTKEKATPMPRSPGILPSDFASGLRGLLTAHPCAGSKLGAIPRAHPAGLSAPARRDIGAPFSAHPARPKQEQQQGQRQRQRQRRREMLLLLWLERAFGASGPLTRGAGAKEKPEGWPAGCGPVRRQSMDGLSANPVAPVRTPCARSALGARVRGGLSFGYFSLATQRKVTRSPQASESTGSTRRRETQPTKEKETPTPRPYDDSNDRGSKGKPIALGRASHNRMSERSSNERAHASLPARASSRRSRRAASQSEKRSMCRYSTGVV